jgi:hypothetical protein
MCDNAGA